MMSQLRLRRAMALIAIIAVSLAVGGRLERMRQESAARANKAPVIAKTAPGAVQAGFRDFAFPIGLNR